MGGLDDPMIPPALGALLIPAVGAGAAGVGRRCGTQAAITLSAITVFTNPEHPIAASNPLPQNH